MSLPLAIRFYLTSEDKVVAYNAQLNHACKPVLRYILIALGWLGIFGPTLFFLINWTPRPGLLDLLFFLTGALLIRAWLIAPAVRRNKLRKEGGVAKMISVTIDENAVTEESGDEGKIAYQWTDIESVVETSKGIIIYHNDRSTCWLPARAFETPTALDEFLNLAGRKDRL